MLAIAFVAMALLSTQVAELLWRSSALLVFAAAIALSTMLCGLIAGLTTVLFSTIAVDFFYIPPIFSVNMDRSTLWVGLQYTILTVLVHAIVRYASARVRTKAKLGVFGQLDGVVNGEAYGWALDADNPSSPLGVMIYVNHQPVAEAAAVYYRPDIASRMNCSGRNGFYVDLSNCCSGNAEALVEARFSNPVVLTNSAIRTHIPVRKERQSPTVLFMHIPKTAGTAFREAITPNYKQAEIAYVYPDPPGFPIPDLCQLPLQQRSWFRLVIGHFRYGVHEWFPGESTYVTVVRHPLARVISHYLFLSETNPAVFTEGKRRLDLVEALELRVTVDLDNAMVRCFGGIDDKDMPPGTVGYEAYDRARHNLRTAFSFVGHQECAQESYTAMRKRFDWGAVAALDWVNRSTTAVDLFQQKRIRSAVEYHNHWDYLLYEDILRLFPFQT